MKICFYAPFKPLGHAHPSGDLATAAGIFDFLAGRGHRLVPASSLRCRWIYWKPWLWPQLIWERHRVVHQYASDAMDLWFTYHSYYKAPDLLGPAAARQLKVPYIIFQGIYSTKRKRHYRTLPGYFLNKKALRAAEHIFTNKKVDLRNLKRLLPADHITYVAPGINPDDFFFDAAARDELRRQWRLSAEPVIFSAAMFRAGVKTQGLTWVIRACGELLRQGYDFRLVIAGDGQEREKLQKLAAEQVADKVRFIGHIPRPKMHRFYSAADLFVFPGIRESLGMVFLEAQSCGLPVVAFDNAGVPEAIQNGRTGLLVAMDDHKMFVDAIRRLLSNPDLRRQMGQAAASYVRAAHDLNQNYQRLESVLQNIVNRNLFTEKINARST